MLRAGPLSPLPLPEGWSLTDHVDDAVNLDGLSIRRVGLCATSAHGQATGSAADVGDDPGPRATFELLERIALAESGRAADQGLPVRSPCGEVLGSIPLQRVFPLSDAPERWAFARSSGVSLHSDWSAACNMAAAELVERDRLLRAWLGETRAVRIRDTDPAWPHPHLSCYDWRTYVFPSADAAAVGRDLDVVGVFGFPKSASVPLVFGFAARRQREDALRGARREALQLLAFLWGEPIPEKAPDPAPSPMAHLESYQVRERHGILERWLEEGHGAFHRPPVVVADMSFTFVDVTPPWLEGRLHVAKALCPAAIPLVFGQAPLLAHLPPELRIHPIP